MVFETHYSTTVEQLQRSSILEAQVSSVSPYVWGALALRTTVFIVVVAVILRRTLSLRREVSERKFAARYDARTILRGVFLPQAGWEAPFDQRDIAVLRRTRNYFVYIATLSLLVVFINQQTQNYIDQQLVNSTSPSSADAP